jgi:hypothetical protein
MNKSAATATINALESMLSTLTAAGADAAQKKLDHAIDKAQVYAPGVEGKNAEQRDAIVTLATAASADALLKAEVLYKTLQAAVEIQRLRVEVAMAQEDVDMPF